MKLIEDGKCPDCGEEITIGMTDRLEASKAIVRHCDKEWYIELSSVGLANAKLITDLLDRTDKSVQFLRSLEKK